MPMRIHGDLRLSVQHPFEVLRSNATKSMAADGMGTLRCCTLSNGDRNRESSSRFRGSSLAVNPSVVQLGFMAKSCRVLSESTFTR